MSMVGNAQQHHFDGADVARLANSLDQEKKMLKIILQGMAVH